MSRKNSNIKIDFIGWIISLVVALAVFLIGNYLFIPRIGWSVGLLLLIAASAGCGLGVSAIRSYCADYYDEYSDSTVRTVTFVIVTCVLVLALLISLLASWTWFHEDEAKSRLDMTTITREELIDKLPDVDAVGAYSWADSDTAKKLAARKTGELTELVSLYTISNDVTTTVSDGKIVKYIPLEYGGFFKAMKSDTIPGYIVVDPVTQKAEYVECSISYSPSAFFGKDLERHLRNNYPNDYLGDYTFQVAPDGVPYWVCELRKGCGSWFVKETYAVAVVNAQTGECTKYAISETPDWVMSIYGDTAMEYYNSYGSLINGYWNLSQVGETSTTDNFGYVAIDGELYYYTGITSAVVDGGDEANMGVMLYNAHTDKAYYCEVAGAEEYSAMEEAEGVVQDFGYKASFPSLTNVDGKLTYVMVLKSDNGVVKQYGMVNYEDYTIAVTADTLNACRAAYNKAIAQDGTIGNDAPNLKEVVVTVDTIEYIVQGGETTVYVRDVEGDVYKSSFDENFLFVETGDKLSLRILDDSTRIITVVFNSFVEIDRVENGNEELVETQPST
jgi:hypothetical protein